MGNLLRRKWHLMLIVLIAVAVIIGLVFGPLVIKVFGTLAGIYLILFLILRRRKGPDGKINPWYASNGRQKGGGIFPF